MRLSSIRKLNNEDIPIFFDAEWQQHSCRHYFATAVLAASDNNLILTSRVMRHSNPATTMRYADLVNGAEQKVVSSLFHNLDLTPMVAPTQTIG